MFACTRRSTIRGEDMCGITRVARGRIMGAEGLRISEQVVIPEEDLSWTAARSSGPGGQNVNKVSSKVELRFDLVHTTALPEEVKGRLRLLAGRRLDKEGRLVVVSQATRDQQRNLEDARAKLCALVLASLEEPKPRTATRPSRGARRRRLEDKRRQGEKKRARGKAGDDC
jgi:ribosome-associated protein